MRFLITASALLISTSAAAELPFENALASYQAMGIRYEQQTRTIDTETVNDLEARLTATGSPQAAGVVTALRTGLFGADLHTLSYKGSDYSANYLVKDGEVVLAYFFLPVFSLTGSSPPPGFIEIATGLSAAMTDGAVSAQTFETVLQEAMEEAHAYHEGTSSRTYPGAIFDQGPTYNYSAVAVVPDWVELTVTRFPQCAYGYRQRGWLMQHVCAEAE